MSTYASDQEMGEIRDENGSWIDVASDSLVAMKVRLVIEATPTTATSASEINLLPDQAEAVADAIKRQVAKVRERMSA